MKIRNSLRMILVIILFVIGGCSSEKPVENVSRHGVVNLDDETIKEFEKGILHNTPIRFDQDLSINDIIEVWGKPDKHFDYEEIQAYVYTKNNQNIIIKEDEMKSIDTVQVELDYSKEEIMKIMGKPTTPGKHFQYEKGDYLVQFEKYDKKWRLIFMRNYHTIPE